VPERRPSRRGIAFFYTNPLQFSSDYERKAYYEIACCPAKVARLVAAQLPGFIDAQHDDVPLQLDAGFAVTSRTWNPGDVVELGGGAGGGSELRCCDVVDSALGSGQSLNWRL
jgi:hypothetical protein